MATPKEGAARNLLNAILSSNAQEIKVKGGHFIFLVESISKLKITLEEGFKNSKEGNQVFDAKKFGDEEKKSILYELAVLIDIGKEYGKWNEEAWDFLMYLKDEWRLSK